MLSTLINSFKIAFVFVFVFTIENCLKKNLSNTNQLYKFLFVEIFSDTINKKETDDNQTQKSLLLK